MLLLTEESLTSCGELCPEGSHHFHPPCRVCLHMQKEKWSAEPSQTGGTGEEASLCFWNKPLPPLTSVPTDCSQNSLLRKQSLPLVLCWISHLGKRDPWHMTVLPSYHSFLPPEAFWYHLHFSHELVDTGKNCHQNEASPLLSFAKILQQTCSQLSG